jgi:dihydroxyacetone kinase-like predicted kinase
VQAAVATLEPGYELLTIYHGDGTLRADAEALAERLRDQVPGVEVEVVSGGQRLYRYLIAAE